MILYKTIKQAQSVQFSKCGILFLNIIDNEDSNKVEITIYNTKLTSIIFQKIINRAPFNFYDKYLFYQSNDKYVILDILTGEHIDIATPPVGKMQHLSYIKNTKRYLVVSDHNLVEYYDFQDKKWENTFNGIIKPIEENLLILYHYDEHKQWNKNLLSRIDEMNGNVMWTFNVKENITTFRSVNPYDRTIEIVAIIGKYQDQIWLTLGNGDLLCLNYSNGKVMKYLRDVPENIDFKATPYGKYPILANPNAAQIDHENGRIICFWKWYHWEIDLKTFEIEFYTIKELTTKTGFMNTSTTNGLVLVNNQVISVDCRKNKIAAYNRNFRSFDWIKPLPKGDANGRAVLLNHDLVYVKTGREVHVFERESSN